MTDRYARFDPRPEDQADDGRTPGRRDRDRILYSSAFRRLAGITQVVSATDRHPIHNRLTHTLEVAQIGRSIAENLLRQLGKQSRLDSIIPLGGLDPDVVEAACLAHDLGHPPFGHVTEEELDRLVKDVWHVADGFEGNAQTFRNLTKLAVRRRDGDGLNLSRATLCAVLKYPWPRGTDGDRFKKWGAYSSETTEFEWARELMAGGDKRSLEAELMDWSDDIAYAVHDVEDFYRAGVIPLDKLATNEDERSRFIEAELGRNEKLKKYDPNELADAFNGIMIIAPIFAPYHGGKEDRARIRRFTSSLVGRYLNAVSIVFDSSGAASLAIDDQMRMEVAMLKGLTWQYVIDSRALIAQRYGHTTLVSSLFATLTNAGKSTKDRRLFPQFYQELLGDSPDDKTVVRTVADLIASLTESQTIALHLRLTGVSLGGSLDPILA